MIQTAPVYWYDNIDSTSEEAKRRARRGETSAVWIAAKQQDAGKGRLGRSWVSPVGNLFCTLLFPEPGGLKIAARIPFAAAIAVRDTCEAVTSDLGSLLKWPNDVRVRGQKISGILTETGETNGVVWIALGMGINVQHAPDNIEQAATSLVQEGAPSALTPELVLDHLRQSVSSRIEQARLDFSGLLDAWLQAAEGRGQRVQAGPVNNRIEGVFETLAEDGGLVLRLPDGAQRIIRAGDVDLVKRVS
ncbi:MAG: biotin--[acetyl-CoA-carboxylase] ligase [Pseudomonadota bacterium]